MQYLRLHAHVEFVSGSQLGALYDLKRGQVRTVPLLLGRILEAFEENSLTQVLKQCFAGNQELFQRYTNFLVEGEWAFITTRPQQFPAASLQWESAFSLNTAVVAHDFLTPYDLVKALGELSAVGCRHLELQLHNYPTKGEESKVWGQIAAALQKGEFRRGTLVQTRDDGAVVSVADIDQHLKGWPRFGTVVLLAQNENRNFEAYGRKYYLRKVSTVAEYARKTWQQHPDTHFVGPTYFREARVANPYFNRRLAIDRGGAFKNDLLYGGQETFGVIGQRPIAEVIADPPFQARWQAGPDAIAETKDNPFRYCLRYDRALTINSGSMASWSSSPA